MLLGAAVIIAVSHADDQEMERFPSNFDLNVSTVITSRLSFCDLVLLIDAAAADASLMVDVPASILV